MARLSAVVMLAMMMAACGPADSGSEPRPEADGVFDPMVDTMDKARGVEDLSQDRKKELDDALEE